MEVVYKDASKDLTIEDGINLYELGIATAVNNGKDVTFTTNNLKKEELNKELHRI